MPSAKDKSSASKKQSSKGAVGKETAGKSTAAKQTAKKSAAKAAGVKAAPKSAPAKKPVAGKAAAKPIAAKTQTKAAKSGKSAAVMAPKSAGKSPVKSPVKPTVKPTGKPAQVAKGKASSAKPSSKSTVKPASKPIAKSASKGAAVAKPQASKGPAQKATAQKATAQKSSASKPNTAVAPAKPSVAPAPAPVRTVTRIQPDDIIIPKKVPLPIPPKTNTDPKIVEKIRSAHAEKELRKDLAQPPTKRRLTPNTPVVAPVKGEDRIVLMVRDPYWLHAHWDISRATVDRAKAALVDQWHSVKPVLRLLKFDEVGTTESAETVAREIEIHGGVRNWYIDVDNPPSRFQVIMGYRTGNGRFYELVRSNSVTTPVPGSKDSFDDHWADIAKDAERIYAMSGGYGDETNKGQLAEVFEDRLKRTMELDVLSQFGSGAEGGLRKARQFHFDVEAELLVFGTTHPDAHVSIGTEPVKVLADGTFSARLPFPDRRQVLPATARSRDGVDERTVVIAVERNTKVMEPLSMDAEDL